MEAEQQDLRERDELAERIKNRDRKNKRHIVSKSEASGQAEAAKRLKLSESKDNQSEMMKKLREESRRAYLPKRRDDKLYEMKRQLQEDEAYFPDAELTDKERAERQQKRQILQAAEKYDQSGNILTAQRYHMPDEKKTLVDTLPEEKELKGGDGRRWEEERLHTGQFHVGSKDAKVGLNFYKLN